MDSSTPTAFLIGDSIAGGYADLVGQALAGEVTVQLRPQNGGDSRKVRSCAADWLRGDRFSVIHFNCGLHDIKRPHGPDTIQVSIGEYEANLRQILSLLRQYADVLIWARTTPVIDGQPHPLKSFDRFNRDIDAYNAVADRIMAESGISVNDLHGAVAQAGIEECLSDDGVHMTTRGNRILGRAVADAIRSAVFTSNSAHPSRS